MKKIILGLLITINIAASILWLKIDTRPPDWDQSTHINLVLDYAQVVKDGQWNKILGLTSTYPPLYHLSLVPALLLSHYSVPGAILTNLLYLIIILLATYFLGAHLFGEFKGLAACWLVSTYPFLLYISRNALTETALTAWVVLSLLCFYKSQNFSSRSWSIFFGLSFSLGMLTKWTFFFFLAPPLIWTIAVHWRKEWKNSLIVLGIILITAFPWYYSHFPQIIRYCLKYSQCGIVEGDPQGFTWPALTRYFWGLEELVFLPYFILFIAGVLLYFFSRHKGRALIVWGVGLPYLINSLMINKDVRYIMPILPALAVISSLAIGEKGIKKIFLGLLIIWGSFQFVYSSFGKSEKKINYFGHPLTIYDAYPPKAENWQNKEIFDYILKNRQGKDPLTVAGVVANYPIFHSSSLAVYTRCHQLPVYPLGYRGRLGEFSEFVIYKTADYGPESALGGVKEGIEQIESPPQWFSQSFQKVFSVNLPDGSQGIIYQRKVKPYPLALSVKNLKMKLSNLTFDNFSIQNPALEIIPYSGEETARGHFRKIIITAPSFEIKGIKLNNLNVVFDEVQINLWRLILESRLNFHYCQKIYPRFSLNEADTKKYLEMKAEWLKDVDVRFNNNIEIRSRLKRGNIPISAKGKIYLAADKNNLNSYVEKIKFGFFTIPSFLYARSLNRIFSLLAAPEWPVNITVEKIAIEEGKIQVN
ncbi:MAG: glycosyltransferase family 39 protein [Elusimicrobiota bacterium]